MRRLHPFRLVLGALALLIAGCATTGIYHDEDPGPAVLPPGDIAYTVYLVGNTGDLVSDAALRQLGADARAAGEESAVVVLGDVGGPDALAVLADALAGYEGEMVAVPGDRDDRSDPPAERLSRLMGVDVEGPTNKGDGVAEHELLGSLRIVAIDTPGWLGADDAETDWDAAEAASELARVAIDHRGEQLIVVGHHPMASNGEHGGRRTALEGAASLGVVPMLAPTVGLSSQDLAAPGYRQFVRALSSSLGGHERLVYAAAHDHSLQAFARLTNGGRDRQPLLVSGTGGGSVEAAEPGRGALFVGPRPGYWRLTYYPDGRLWGEAVAVERDGSPRVIYRAAMAEPDPELEGELLPDPVVEVAPDFPEAVRQTLDAGFDEPFANGALTRFVAGAGYRDAWKTPVELPVLDLGALGGGLTPLRMGGGNQTTSLRMQGEDGHVYEVRLIEKGGTSGLPEPLQDGAAADILLDLRSAAFPYGAVIAAHLARSADIYASQPRILYVPDDPRLGDFRETFGDKVAHVEVRADDDMSDLPGWEGITNVISDESLRERLYEDPDNRIDQRAFLRARLIDLMVGDWDRHAGQWRWAEVEPGDLDPSLGGEAATRGKVYLPVPRDRDWAFYNLGGLTQNALFYTDRRYQSYGPGYGSLLGLTQSARGQDRRFLNGLTREDVMEEAAELRAALSDAAIDRALDLLPEPVAAEVADDWRRGLRGRRDRLDYAATRLYEMASRVVPVVGSDEPELFRVASSGPGAVAVTVHVLGDDGQPGREVFRRVVRTADTDEIHLFGQRGDDVFDIASETGGVRVRVVGGDGLDRVESAEGGTLVYDTPDGAEIDGRAHDLRSSDPGINRYDEDQRVIPTYLPAPIVGARATDGVILGASLTKVTPGFRVEPYSSRQSLAVDVATSTGGVRSRYDGHFRELAGPFDVRVGLLGALPRNVRNYYGLGNGTDVAGEDQVRLNLARAEATVAFEKPLGPGALVGLGPTLRYADPSQGDEAFGPLAELPASAYGAQGHAGAQARLFLSTVDSAVNPRQGARLEVTGAALGALGGQAEPYGTVDGVLAAFVPLGLQPQLVLALRAGGSHRIGAFPFFDAAVIGQSTSVRGYRRERFAGRSSAFGNAELRAKVFTLGTFLAPLDVGVLGFADAGRVWIGPGTNVAGLTAPRVAESEDIHVGYGGGVWVGVIDRAILNLTVQASEEETLASFGVGFQF